MPKSSYMTFYSSQKESYSAPAALALSREISTIALLLLQILDTMLPTLSVSYEHFPHAYPSCRAGLEIRAARRPASHAS